MCGHGRRQQAASRGRDATKPGFTRSARDRRGSLRLRVPDDRRLQGDVPVQHRQDVVAVQGAVQHDLERLEGRPPYKDTAIVTPNSDTPYSMVQADLRAEPIVLCVPKVDKARYYSVQLVDMYTFNYGYIGSRATGSDAGCYLVAGPDWKGRRSRRRREGVPERDAVQLRHLPHAALRSERHREREEDPGRLQGADALEVREAARPARGARRSPGPPSPRTRSRPTSPPTSTSCCSSVPRCRRRRRCARASHASASARQDLRLEEPVARAEARGGTRRQGRLREDHPAEATRSARS